MPLWPPLTPRGFCTIYSFTQEKRTRETGPALFATPVSFVRKLEGANLAQPGRRPYPQNDERFWSIRPRLKSTKNWSPDSHRGSRLHFEWKVSGFTVVSFWTAPVVPPPRESGRWNSALGTRLRPGTAQTALGAGRLSPNRCLAGLQPPRAVQVLSCSTENQVGVPALRSANGNENFSVTKVFYLLTARA